MFPERVVHNYDKSTVPEWLSVGKLFALGSRYEGKSCYHAIYVDDDGVYLLSL